MEYVVEVYKQNHILHIVSTTVFEEVLNTIYSPLMPMLSQAISTTKVLDYAIAINQLSVLPCKIIPVSSVFWQCSVFL